MAGHRTSALSGWVHACHPLPTAAVTTIVTALAAALGWHGAALVGLAAAVLLGQLSIGWSNDAHDAAADVRALRRDKPVVAGTVRAPHLWWAAGIAAALSVVLSLAAAGWIGGMWHVAAVAMAWWYNVQLSRTVMSWVPYAVSFACLAPFLTLGLNGTWPAVWLPVVLALMGTAAHLANAGRDLERDRSIALSGAAVRLGAARTSAATWVLLGIATLVLAAVLVRVSLALAAAAVGALLAVLIAVLVTVRVTKRADAPFVGVIVLALLDVTLVAVALHSTA